MSVKSVPLNLVGVDPFYHSHLKLMIGHVHQIAKRVDERNKPTNLSVTRAVSSSSVNPWINQSSQSVNTTEEQYPPDTLLFGGHVIKQVEIVGVIVSLADKNKYVVYHIDDGSGVIKCLQWVETSQSDDQSTGQWVYRPKDQVDIQSIYQAMRTLNLRLGDTVRVLGKVILGRLEPGKTSEHRADTSIKVISIQLVTDPNAEMLHVVECMRLYPLYQSIDPSLLAVNQSINQMRALYR